MALSKSLVSGFLLSVSLSFSPVSWASNSVEGLLGIGLMSHKYEEREDNNSGRLIGIEASGQISFGLGASSRLVTEMKTEYVRLGRGKEWEDHTPTQASLFSARIEHDFSMLTGSIFLGVGSTNSHNRGNGVGGFFGGSVLLNLTPGSSFYLTLGSADVRVDVGTGDNDNGFTGSFGEIGAVQIVGDGFALKPYYGYGKAPDGFTASNEKGNYRVAGIQGIMKLASLNSFLRIGIEQAKFEAPARSLSAEDKRITLGLIIPFGGSSKTSFTQALNPLSVPLAPMRAAAYAQNLD